MIEDEDEDMIEDEDEDEYHILDVLSYKKIKLLT